MRVLFTLSLLFVLIGLVSGQPRHLRGIKRSEQAKFTGTSFTCFDQSAVIPSNQVNDDYCDCADGSDEPGTSACLSSQFYCANKLATPLTLPSSRVNDMICDCCDGSDEWMELSGSPCPNTCEEEGRARHAAILQEIAATEQGLKVRAELVERAQQIKREKEAQRAVLETKLAERRAALDAARAAQAVEEEKENAERARLQAIEEANHPVDPEFQALANAAAQTPADAEPVKVEDEHVIASETAPAAESASAAFPYPAEYAYKPAEADQVVHQEVESFPYPQEYAYQAGGAENENKEEQKDEAKDEPKEEAKDDMYYSEESSAETTDAAHSVSAASSYVLDCTYLITSMFSHCHAHVTNLLTYLNWFPESASAAEAARQVTREMEEKVERSQNKMNDLDAWLKGDYGDDLEFVEFADQCFSLNEKQYVYEICLFKEAHQREGGSSTSLGRWSSIRKPDEHHEFTRFAFENGAGCWQGPARSLEVNLICGVSNEIKSVEEPSRCVYSMMMTTPAVCSAERAESLKKQLADQTETADE